jgi:hypothetical protein
MIGFGAPPPHQVCVTYLLHLLSFVGERVENSNKFLPFPPSLTISYFLLLGLALSFSTREGDKHGT